MHNDCDEGDTNHMRDVYSMFTAAFVDALVLIKDANEVISKPTEKKHVFKLSEIGEKNTTKQGTDDNYSKNVSVNEKTDDILVATIK